MYIQKGGNVMALGDNIKLARKSKGLTQKQLADLIGAKHNSISNWENNQNFPDPDTIELICGALDVSPSDLLSCKNAVRRVDSVSKYKTLLAYLNLLSDVGILEAEKRLKELTYIPEYRKYKDVDYLIPVAAHKLEVENQEEADQHDDNIMNDENF